MNSFNGIGRLTADPKVKAFSRQDGSQGYFSHATLAVDYLYGKERKTTFIPVTIPGAGATNLKKGNKIAITAEVQDASYTDEAGVKHFGICFFVNTWEYAESKKDGTVTGAQAPVAQAAPITAQPQVTQTVATAQAPVVQQAPIQANPVAQAMVAQAASVTAQPQTVPTSQPQMPTAQVYAQPQAAVTYPNAGMPGVPANPAGAMAAPMPQDYGMSAADMMQADAAMQELPFN